LATLPTLDRGATAFTGSLHRLVETTYWILPKPADFNILLQNALHAGDHFGSVPAFAAVQKIGAFYPELSALSSLAFAIVMLATATRQLATTDY